MFKKVVFFVLAVTILLFPGYSFAQINQKVVDVYFFWQIGCPHCEKEQMFLDKLQEKYVDTVNIQGFEISQNEHNVNLLIDLGKRMNKDVGGVPFTAVFDLRDKTGQTHEGFTGFDDENGIGKSIETYIDYLLYTKENGVDVTTSTQTTASGAMSSVQLENFKIPLLGMINLKTVSLPLVTIVIGLLDGFNPCAMWTLLFLIGLLLKMENKKRMWLLGVLFIIASGTVYFVFMAAWLQLLLFLGMITAIRITIGLVGVGLGTLNLRDYWKNRKVDVNACKVSKSQSTKKTLEKIKDIVYRKSLWWSIIGILLLGFSVNLIELACSAGFPAVFTQLLAISNLPIWQRYLYMVGYIIFYMLDDMIVFAIAMVTLQSKTVGGRYVKYSNLIGGLLILILGLLLIFKPAWLMFG